MTLATRLWRAHLNLQTARRQSHLRLLRQRAAKTGNHRRWREHRITKHMPLVERIAKQVAPMFARQIPLDDLVSAGMVGLCAAADRFDASKQPDFDRYAWFVVRGAIIDAHKRRAYREEQHVSIQGMQERMGYLPPSLVRDSAPLPDAIAEQREKVRTVAMLISELPAQDAALMRAVMAGASVADAARSVGRCPAWGRARLAAARDRLGAGVILR